MVEAADLTAVFDVADRAGRAIFEAPDGRMYIITRLPADVPAELVIPTPPSAPAFLAIDDVAERMGVSRSSLDRLLPRLPPGLPGEPYTVGVGTARKRRRWCPDTVDAWIEAARAARRPPAPVTTEPARRSARKRRPPAASEPVQSLTGFARAITQGK